MGIMVFMITLNAQRPGRGMDRPQSIAGIQGLDLSEQQQEQLQELRVDHYKAMKPMKTRMVELKARQRTLLSEEEVDMKALNKVIDDETGLMNKMRKEQVAHQVEVKKMLTDEQLMKLEQRRMFRRDRWEQGNEFRRNPNRGRPYHRNVG